jgi:hypothetical protein
MDDSILEQKVILVYRNVYSLTFLNLLKTRETIILRLVPSLIMIFMFNLAFSQLPQQHLNV